MTDVFILMSGNKLKTANVYSQSRIEGVFLSKERAEEEREARARYDFVDEHWVETHELIE